MSAAKKVDVRLVPKAHAVAFVREHHSRLPKTQASPWSFAFGAFLGGEMVGAALWLNPSARTLPSHWLELRRMALSPSAPKFTASRFMARMTRFFRANHPDREQLISYHDVAVHKGTIYAASGWVPLYVSKPRHRDRSKARKGTNRQYRSDLNGRDVAASAKIRWHQWINPTGRAAIEGGARVDIALAATLRATK